MNVLKKGARSALICLGGTEAHESFHIGADKLDLAGGIGGPDHIGYVGNQRTVFLFTLVQRPFSLPARGDVFDMGNEVGRGSLGVVYRRDLQPDPDGVASLVDIALLEFHGGG